MPKTSPSLSTYTTMMRVNSKGRPYAKDLNDLFSALLIQLPLTDHRSLFRNYASTFTTDEAVQSLGNLQFTHLVSTPNPLDPANPILTRTTTTFSMSRDMAKTLGQHFLNARLVENATDPQSRTLKDRGIWLPTPKGKHMIQDFSQRAQVAISHMQTPLNRIPNFQIVQFERLLDDDQISFSRPNMMQAFTTMMQCLPTQNIMIDDIGGVDGFAGIDSYRNSFYGYHCFEWIMEYTSVVSSDEAESIAAEFVLYGWIQQVVDKSDKELNKKDEYILFKNNRKIQYYLTDKGRSVLDGDTYALHHNQVHSNGGVSMASTNSRSQSSASSSNGSIRTGYSGGVSKNSNTLKTSIANKEEHIHRLLPTTEEVDSENTIVPQAVITKRRTISKANDSAIAIKEDDTTPAPSIAESILQIENSSCDFGFSSASSTTSSTATTVYQESSSLLSHSSSKRNALIDHSNDSRIQEQLQKLKIASSYLLVDATNSQNSKLQSILKDPLIRMYFRQFLKSNFCEENINFWVDYTALVKKMGGSLDANNRKPKLDKVQSMSTALTESLLTHCCVLYNTYFCPYNAPSELNIDHGLRNDIITYMQATFVPSTSAKTSSKKENPPASGVDAPFGSISVSSYGILTSSVARNGNSVNASPIIRQGIKDNPQMCLYKLLQWYDLVNDHVCKTMAEDSVPRFIKTRKYQDVMKNYDHQAHQFEEEDEGAMNDVVDRSSDNST